MEEEKKESNRIKIENIKNERKYEFILEKESPLGETYDVLCEFRNYIKDIMIKYEESETCEETQG